MMAQEQRSKIKLYWLDQSRAQRIVWLLEELKLEYEIVVFHRDKDMFAPPELEKVHQLGKSPLVGITPEGSSSELILAESGFIAQYLCDHFAQGTTMMPRRYKDAQDGKVCGETEEWMRLQYYLQYVEGSLMPPLIVALILSILKGDKIPFFIRPITSVVADKTHTAFVARQMKSHFGFLESQLATAPGGGGYLCGAHLTAADILISYPLTIALRRGDAASLCGGKPEDKYPRLWAYFARLENEPGYAKAMAKIEKIEGKRDKPLQT